MKMLVVFNTDKSWCIGDRNQKAVGHIRNHESKGTHHFFIVNAGDCEHMMKGDEVAVPISSAKFFNLNYKRGE